jgi:hypothetical protein
VFFLRKRPYIGYAERTKNRCDAFFYDAVKDVMTPKPSNHPLKPLTRTAILSAFLFVMAALFPAESPAREEKSKNPPAVQVTDTVSDELAYLLRIASLPKTEQAAFDPGAIENLLDFVLSEKKEALYHADKKKFSNQVSAYHEFDMDQGMERLLKLAYHPDIPGFSLAPTSMRVSRWLEEDGSRERMTGIWKHLDSLDRPVILRGTERIVNTPDQFSGGYYAYGLNRTVILFKHRGRNVLISLSRQPDVSDVGKRGVALGSDENWDYLYSGKKGLTKAGLEWVRSYMYDSSAVAIVYETSPDQRRHALFKWLRAGWLRANVVKKKHIYQGLKRYAGAFKKIVESPFLPGASELAAAFSGIRSLSEEDLKEKARAHLKNLEKKYSHDKDAARQLSRFLKDRDAYLAKMTKEEMRSILVLEHMKKALKKTPVLGVPAPDMGDTEKRHANF